MSGLNTNQFVSEYFRAVNAGWTNSYAPLLPLFKVGEDHMSTELHYQLAPFFTFEQPRSSVYMCARQVGKSYGLSAQAALRSHFYKGFHTLIIEPRADQLARYNATILRPILKHSLIRDEMLNRQEISKFYVKEFNSGSMIYLEYCYLNPERVRGISNIACCSIDESVSASTPVTYIDSSTNERHTIPISEIRAGMLLDSFTDEGYSIRSVVAKDASYHGIRGCYRITTEGGRTIEATADHPLWTSEGPLRVGEIIEHVYRTPTENTGHILTGTGAAAIGDLAGGRGNECAQMATHCELSSPSRRSATQLQSGKIHDIIRVRDTGTRIDYERRLQSLLVGNSPSRGLSLSIQTDLQREDQEGFTEEGSNTGMVGPGRRKRPRLVNRGRRMSCSKSVHDDMHTELSPGRAISTDRVVGRPLRSRGRRTNTHAGRPALSAIGCIQHVQTDKTNQTAYARVHGLQIRSERPPVQRMRGTHIQGPKARKVLRVSLSGRTEEVARRTQRRVLRIQETMGSRQQRAGSRMRKGSLRCRSGKSQRSTTTLQGKIPGACKGSSAEIPQASRGYGERPHQTEGCISQEYERSGKGCSHQSSQKSMVGGSQEGSYKVRGVQSQAAGIGPQIQGAIKGEESFDLIKSVEYIGEQPVYDIEVVGTHNYILANSCKSLNCQDIDYDFLPIIFETMSANRYFGFQQFTGTPKTSDGTLAVLWNDSSMAEWCIPCTHCRKKNIPSIEQDLLKMIGKKSIICSKCGGSLDGRNGYYVHARPSRAATHAGYHFCQVTHPLHYGIKQKWQALLGKMEGPGSYSKAKFYNEVLGVPCDENVKLLSQADLIAAATKRKNTAEAACKDRNKYSGYIMGVDWSGGGDLAESFTAISVVGFRAGTDVVDCVYAERIAMGMSPEEEAAYIMDQFRKFQCVYLAHDYGGAGYIRESLMRQAGLPDHQIIPFTYVSTTNKDVITYNPPTGQGTRFSYSIDKARSLAILCAMVRANKISFPEYTEESRLVLDDLLNLVELPRELPRGNIMYLIGRAPKKPDDFAHALNYAASAVWYTRQSYPDISVVSDKFKLTDQQLALAAPSDPEKVAW